MFSFKTIGQIEHGYYFEDAVIEAEVFNGAIGEVTDGVFAPAAEGTKLIMQLENGDNAGLDKFPIAAGSHVRVLDVEKFATKAPNAVLQVYGTQIPAKFPVVGDKLVADENGNLVKDADADDFYFEVVKVIGNKEGIEVKVYSSTVADEVNVVTNP